jgi:hypothetical protein
VARDIRPDLAACYHQHWEFEIALAEIETHQIAHTRVLRSTSPEMVRQEIWGILLAHYAVRTLMVEVAHYGDADPDRLSFLDSLRVICEADSSAEFPLTTNTATLCTAQSLKFSATPTPTPAPRLPRVIKRYGPCSRPIKRPEHKGTRCRAPASIEIAAA